MNDEHIAELLAGYRDSLLKDTLPFWIEHAVDRVDGGFHTFLDREGNVFDTDKGMWPQCRFTWILATLARELGKTDPDTAQKYGELAAHGIEFIKSRGFDDDGRMFFHVTHDGRPLRKRRYVFTELFAVMALSAWARLEDDEDSRREAVALFRRVVNLLTQPEALTPKLEPKTRRGKSIAVPMLMLVTGQELRGASHDPIIQDTINSCIEEIERDFVRDDLDVVLELVSPDGELIDHVDGRTLNPGHAMEAAWFILEEARHQDSDQHLIEIGTKMLDWMWERGWDREHGGILYYTYLGDGEVQEYWHDMKFWWPQTETILATLLAHLLTGAPKYAQWHQDVHEWADSHFRDSEHGEWFGYLHRDGGLSTATKGNLWKGPFHLPRMQWHAWRWLEELGVNP